MHATAQALVCMRDYEDELKLAGRPKHSRRSRSLGPRTHNLAGERGDPLPVYPRHMENGRSMAHGPDGLLPHLQEVVHAVELGTHINAAMHFATDASNPFVETTALGPIDEAEKKKNDRGTSALDEMTDHPYGQLARGSLEYIEDEEAPGPTPASAPEAAPLVPPALARKETNLILRAFRDHDHQATGLNATELRACLQTMGVTVDEVEAEEVVKTYDTDGDGNIDAGELARIVKDLDVLRTTYPMDGQQRTTLQVPAEQRMPAPGSKAPYRPPGWNTGAAAAAAAAASASASASAAAAAATASALASASSAGGSAAAPEALASASGAQVTLGDEGAGALASPATPQLASIPPRLAPGTSGGTPLTSRAQVALEEVGGFIKKLSTPGTSGGTPLTSRAQVAFEEVGGFIKKLSNATSAFMDASAGDRSPRSPRTLQKVLSPRRAAAAQSSPRPPQPVSV